MLTVNLRQVLKLVIVRGLVLLVMFLLGVVVGGYLFSPYVICVLMLDKCCLLITSYCYSGAPSTTSALTRVTEWATTGPNWATAHGGVRQTSRNIDKSRNIDGFGKPYNGTDPEGRS